MGPQDVGFGLVAIATERIRAKIQINTLIEKICFNEYLESLEIFLTSSFQGGVEGLVQLTRSAQSPTNRITKRKITI